MTKKNKLYLLGAVLLCGSAALPFILNWFNDWPTVRRMGAVIMITGFIFASSLAIFLKKQAELK